MQTKAQISIFIILALVLALSVGTYVYITSTKEVKRIEIDPINKILYVRFADGKVAKTLRHSDGDILVDVDNN